MIPTTMCLIAGTILMYVLFQTRRKFLLDRIEPSATVVGKVLRTKASDGRMYTVSVKYTYNDIEFTTDVLYDSKKNYFYDKGSIPLTITGSGEVELYTTGKPMDMWKSFYLVSTLFFAMSLLFCLHTIVRFNR
jgi:hypothetical protein